MIAPLHFLLPLIADFLIRPFIGLYCLNVSRQQHTSYKDIFNAFEHFGRAFLISIIQGIFIFLWSLLFVIHGIIA